MKNKISYLMPKENSRTLRCPGCGVNKFEAFQCDCGKAFCMTCNPDSFDSDGPGEPLFVTCPDCGAEAVFG